MVQLPVSGLQPRISTGQDGMGGRPLTPPGGRPGSLGHSPLGTPPGTPPGGVSSRLPGFPPMPQMPQMPSRRSWTPESSFERLSPLSGAAEQVGLGCV